MSQIKELILVLSPIDCQNFVKHLSKRNKRQDTRNIDLFNALLVDKEDKIRTAIGPNAFNALSKRLSDRLIDFIASETINNEATSEISVIKQILVARKLFAHHTFKLGFKILRIAEEIAIELSDYTLLNEIYHSLIEFSYHQESPNQKEIFSKFEANQKEYLAQEKINMVYAVIRKAFNDNQFNSDTINLEALFRDTSTKFGITTEQAYNFKTLYQLAEIADIEGTYTKNYHTVNVFFQDKIKSLKNTTLDSEKHLIYHIDLLYLIANIYFRKKQFNESLRYLADMKQQMQRYENRFYVKRNVQYTMLLALTHNYLGDHTDSLNIIDSLIQSGTYTNDELANPLLVKLMIHFQQGELKEANHILIKFNKSDKWYQQQMGMEWLLNKKYLEILLHIELGNTDYADARLLSLNRGYADYFKTNNDFQVLPFLKLIKQYYHNPTIANTTEFKRTVDKTLKWKPAHQEDLFLMSFYAWLKSKMENKPLYETTLALINQTK